MDDEVLIAVTGAAAGLIGTIVGAVVSWYSSERRSKIQNTVDLHREWQSDDMTAIRLRADRLVRENTGMHLLQMELDADPTAYANVLRVLNFFQRLWMLLKHRQLTNYLVPELFGSYIVWWNVNCFEAGIPSKWVLRQDWLSLYAWLEANSSAGTFGQWKDTAAFAKKNRQTGSLLGAAVAQLGAQADGPAPGGPVA
jgi:hypothetical protein